jgi:hypothetical protein
MFVRTSDICLQVSIAFSLFTCLLSYDFYGVPSNLVIRVSFACSECGGKGDRLTFCEPGSVFAISADRWCRENLLIIQVSRTDRRTYFSRYCVVLGGGDGNYVGLLMQRKVY